MQSRIVIILAVAVVVTLHLSSGPASPVGHAHSHGAARELAHD
ncbi:MAG TPA: hypothetical protein VEK57_30630 [Thermoanaerobaculia bacterium]|nr:hypothetical protein [Thermoanaerobaculia bacterium]